MSEVIRQEFNEVKAQGIDLSARVCTLEEASRRFMVAVARITGDMADIKASLTGMATKADISALNARMDGFAGLLEDSRMRWAVHSDTLARHEKLLKRRRS